MLVSNTSCMSTLPALPSVNVDLPQEVPSGCPGFGMYSWSYHSPKICKVSVNRALNKELCQVENTIPYNPVLKESPFTVFIALVDYPLFIQRLQPSILWLAQTSSSFQ